MSYHDTTISMFSMLDMMFENCDIDYDLLINSKIDKQFFENYDQTRIVNSFLFNFSKLQDKIGGKLFKQVLYELKEIDTFSLTMIDVLHILEKLNVLESVSQWDKLREIRNILAHEYPFDIEERVENITLALEGYAELKSIFLRLKKLLKHL